MTEVIDKRHSAVEDKPVDTRFEDALEVPEVLTLQEPQRNPVDVLMEKTFQFITSQPEWYSCLALPRQARKQLGQDLGKLLFRFPHFKKIQ